MTKPKTRRIEYRVTSFKWKKFLCDYPPWDPNGENDDQEAIPIGEAPLSYLNSIWDDYEFQWNPDIDKDHPPPLLYIVGDSKTYRFFFRKKFISRRNIPDPPPPTVEYWEYHAYKTADDIGTETLYVIRIRNA